MDFRNREAETFAFQREGTPRPLFSPLSDNLYILRRILRNQTVSLRREEKHLHRLQIVIDRLRWADGSPWLTDLERSRDHQGNRSGVSQSGGCAEKRSHAGNRDGPPSGPHRRLGGAISSYSDASSTIGRKQSRTQRRRAGRRTTERTNAGSGDGIQAGRHGAQAVEACAQPLRAGRRDHDSATKLINALRARGVESSAIENALEGSGDTRTCPPVISKPDWGLTTLPWGKHKGELLMDIPPSYLRWALRTA